MQAFAELEPFGPLVEERRMGQICATLANVNRRSDARAFEARDFSRPLREALAGLQAAATASLTAQQRSDMLDVSLFGQVGPRQRRRFGPGLRGA